MTLHEAMIEVLRERGGWMDRHELAREIANRDIYRQTAGGPPPSDQLRLRARKYPHLFEGSDPAFTHIRLRPAAGESLRPRGRGAGTAKGQPSDARAAASAEDLASARSRRAAAAEKYKPASVKVLLVAEAPPAAPDRYFYFEDVREQDALFRYVARGVLDVEPTRANKSELLGQLCERGVFLIDLSPDPVASFRLSEFVPELVSRVRALGPEKIILIKATVYDAAFQALREERLPVVDARIPFPGSGQQKRFEAAFARALTARPR